MLNRFKRYFACVLIALLPLQSFAAASMLLCSHNNAKQVSAQTGVQGMPCHQPTTTRFSGHHQDQSNQKNLDICQSICAHLCVNFGSLITLPSLDLGFEKPDATKKLNFVSSFYASITQANLQRPPIYLS